MSQQQVVDPQHDLSISDAIAYAIGRLTEVRESRTPVSFSVENGVVTVSGVAFTETLRRRILYAIATTPGVTRVIDRLVDDEDIRIAVAQALADPTALGAGEAHVIVASYQGVVTLSGRVASDQKRMAAIEAARKVAGVQTVIDNLKAAA